jgi:hypothetical protein
MAWGDIAVTDRVSPELLSWMQITRAPLNLGPVEAYRSVVEASRVQTAQIRNNTNAEQA